MPNPHKDGEKPPNSSARSWYMTINAAEPQEPGGVGRLDLSDAGTGAQRKKVAARVLTERVVHGSTKHAVVLEKESVFGAAVLIPQAARSACWSTPMTLWTIQIYMFVLMSLFMQFALLSLIEKEEMVMDAFSGQPYLCDFGAPFNDCPDDPSCAGPGGTKITPDRLYSFQTWALRSYVRESLKAVFPDRAELIQEQVDPGEYGAESKFCRWICCYIFMIGVMDELANNFKLLELLYSIPSTEDSWIDMPSDSASDEDLEVKVAGMPIRWKILNCLVILIPKVVVWRLTAAAGVTFLMETADINDMIVNAVALNFILQVDEMLYNNLTPEGIRELVDCCRDFQTIGHSNLEETNCMRKIRAYVTLLLPTRALLALFLTAFFIYTDYYMVHCKWSSDGWWVSADVKYPLGTDFTIWQTIRMIDPRYFKLETEEKPVWTMSAQ